MINVYSAVLAYTKVDLKEYLGKLEVFYIFKPLVKEFKDITLFRGAVHFILMAYSIDSEVLHTSGNSWIVMYKTIYQKAGLPDNADVFSKIADMKSEGVREAIELYLAYQSNESFVQYTHARDLRKKCLQDSQSADKLKNRMEALEYSKELLLMMDDAKAGFVENNDLLKPSIEALKKATPKKKETLGPQHYAK